MQLVVGGHQRLVTASQTSRRRPRQALHVAAAFHRHDDFGTRRFPLSEGLPLSLFHPFKKLPADGTTLPAEEEVCDPEEQSCKTPLHVYEARCTACSGTGWARAPSNGRRGHLGTCMVCHGLGFVRRTTSRFCPDDPDKHMTIARPLTWDGKFAARIDRSFTRNGASSNGASSSDASNNGTSSSVRSGASAHGSGPDGSSGVVGGDSGSSNGRSRPGS